MKFNESLGNECINYDGLADVINGYKRYDIDFSNAAENQTHDNMNNNATKINFIAMVGLKSLNPKATRHTADYDKEKYIRATCIFATDYIPINTDLIGSTVDEFSDNIKATVNLFNSEINFIRGMGTYPIILLDHIGNKSYYGWSLSENIPIYVHGFGAGYVENEYLISYDYDGEDFENEKYTVVMPSEELKNALGLRF